MVSVRLLIPVDVVGGIHYHTNSNVRRKVFQFGKSLPYLLQICTVLAPACFVRLCYRPEYRQ